MLTYQNSLQNTLTAGLIGKKVKISGNGVALKGTAQIAYTLPQDAAKVKLSLYDTNGNLVREIDAGPQKSREGSYTWDGKDSTGKTLPDGQYTVKVDAVDASGNALNATATSDGTVTGISYDNNVTYLVIDGKTKVQLSDIKEINGGT
jgi:flagellar basal-body rod modification protein FlgD